MPAGIGASKKVTVARARGAGDVAASGEVTGTLFSDAVASDSTRGMPSSVKLSSRASRAARSGTAKATDMPSATIWRTRPRSLASDPAMPGCLT